MSRLNRDVYVAIVLLLFSAFLFQQTFEIEVSGYGQMESYTWPRAMVILLSVLVVIYLYQSLRAGPTGLSEIDEEEAKLTLWQKFGNASVIFGLFLLYLLSLDFLGMLIGGVLFVFFAMCYLGGFAPKKIALHAVVSLVMVGGMWSIFTFALRVILPEGEILRGLY